MPSEPPDSASPGRLLRGIGGEAKWPLALTYTLFNVENLLQLAQPLVLGWAIDGLLRGTHAGLGWLIAQHLSHLAVGTLRQMYDTRVFTAMLTRLTTRLVLEQRQQGVPVSVVAARSAMSRDFVDFFERDIPLMVSAAYSLCGALVFLAFYDRMLVPYCIVLLVPCMLLNLRYGRVTRRLNGRLHDEFEREIDAIEDGTEPIIRQHYANVARWRVKLSDSDARNFGLMELFVLGLIAATLLRYCAPGRGAVSPGDVFAVFRYMLTFVTALDRVPMIVMQIGRLRDIAGRLSPEP